MNVLKPCVLANIRKFIEQGKSQRYINRKLGVDRKTIRRYMRKVSELSGEPEDLDPSKSPTLEGVATGFDEIGHENPPPWPPGLPENSLNAVSVSHCEPYREWIETQLRMGRNGVAIYQDLVEMYGFAHHYNSVKRFIRKLKKKDPNQFDRLECLIGEEAQVDYGLGALTKTNRGKCRRPRLFVMTLKYSGRCFRKVIWKSSQENWARLHEEAFRYFGGCPEYVILDNLKEGVITPDIFEPVLNSVYAAMLEHYGVTANPARVRDANRKGTVENAIKYTQNTGLKGRRFETIEDQNKWLKHWEERWASTRIFGTSQRQVEALFKEEKPYLKPLPLEPFEYFRQETRTVSDDGLIVADKRYYGAKPALVGSLVTVRIYENEIVIYDIASMEVIRRHQKCTHAGGVRINPEDRIFNPSRQTDLILLKAERIGPNTRALCERWFSENGRIGHKRMYGLVGLVRKHAAKHIEKAAGTAVERNMNSYHIVRRMVERMTAEEKNEGSTKEEGKAKGMTQSHPLIRPGEDYGAFFEFHAASASATLETASQMTIFDEPLISGPAETFTSKTKAVDVNDEVNGEILPYGKLDQVWKRADWRRVIEVFRLSVDRSKRTRDGEIWVMSPFTNEENSSMHLSLTGNVYKDFSSGKSGGIMQFCREMLRLGGREMTMFETGRWMIEAGISEISGRAGSRSGANFEVDGSASESCHHGQDRPFQANAPVKADLRRWLRHDHPALIQRGISEATCRYLGCGYLPIAAPGKQGSPLNSRLVFQIRGVIERYGTVAPVVISHAGRAMSQEQEAESGKYWAYPFRKSLEVYNQDHLLMDEEASRQVKRHGLILVEGFFDVAKLVEAGCRNVVALMGCSLSDEQVGAIGRLKSRIGFDDILLFLDRDGAGVAGTAKAMEKLAVLNCTVRAFDWSRQMPGFEAHTHGAPSNLIGPTIKDPADFSAASLMSMRDLGII